MQSRGSGDTSRSSCEFKGHVAEQLGELTIVHQAELAAVLFGPQAVGLGAEPVLIRACTASEAFRIVHKTSALDGANLCMQIVPSLYEGHHNLVYQRPRMGARRLAVLPFASD